VKPIDFECSLKERARVLDALYEALNGKRMIYLSGVFKDSAKALKLKLEGDDHERSVIDNVDKVHYYWNYRQARYERDD
jgi:hypothetical protein